MLPDRIFRNALIWLGVVAVSLLVMVQPVLAEGTLTNTPTGYKAKTGTTSSSCGRAEFRSLPYGGIHRDTIALACQDYFNPTNCNAAYHFGSASGTYCYFIRDGDGASWGYDNVLTSDICPSNSTGTRPSSCVCNSGYVPDGSSSACEIAPISCPAGQHVEGTGANQVCVYDVLSCPAGQHVEGTGANQTCVSDITCPAAGTLHNSGYYDIGTDPSVKHPDFSPCVNGCLLSYNGSSIVARALHSGVYHYYTQGEYRHEGTTNYCNGTETTAGTNDVVSTVPSNTCAPGQTSIWGGVGGQTICYDAVTGEAASGNSASAVAAAETSNAVAVASAVDAAVTLAQNSGLSASAVEAVRAQTIAGMALDQNTGGGAAGGAAGAQDAVLTNFCRENPSSTICVDADFGEVANVNMLENSISVAINPVSVGGAGSCPAPSPLTIRGQTYFFKWDTFCTFANGIRPILLAFAWLSAAGLMVGGFKS